MIEKKNMLGVGITNATKKEILEYIIKSLENFKKKYFVVTPNPEFLVLANKSPEFKKILNKAELALNDGIGLTIAGKMLGRSLKERFTGVDIAESLCMAVAEKPITVGFLGGREDVAEKTAECLKSEYPGLKVVFAGEEWSNVPAGPVGLHPRPTSSLASLGSGARRGFSRLSSRRTPSSVPAPATRLSFSATPHINYTLDAKRYPLIDILFVAFGAPKQEFWIEENLDKIPVKVAIGVGGAFDYISGRIPRAPFIIRKLGFEWLFRLIIQPWRIRRQLALLEFIWLVLKEKLR